MRLPASITPGECTYQGHGGELSVHVEHQFGPDFLPTTFRNLVINDLIDQLSPLIYEVIRSDAVTGALGNFSKNLLQIQTIDDEIVDWEKNNIQIKPENWQSIKDYVKKLKKMDLVQLGKEKSSLPVQDVRIAVVDMVIRRNGIDDGAKYFENIRKINNVFLPSTRTAKQQYPIAPRELLSTFLPELIWLIANDAREASRTTIIRSLDVRNDLRHTLEMSYDVMTHRTEMVDKDPWDPARVQNPVLADGPFMSGLLELIHQRDFPTLTSSPQDYGRDPAKVSQAARPAGLRAEYNELVKGILKCYRNVGITTLGPLCFAIVPDAALLDEALRNDAIKVFRKKGLPSEPLEGIHFYYPPSVPNDEAKAVFSDYVRYRWPIITFALDPVTDQQNIADSFNLNRDLQLAVSFAFATGQINFSQLNTFRRQIEQSSDTIALNRTVTGFVHGERQFRLPLHSPVPEPAESADEYRRDRQPAHLGRARSGLPDPQVETRAGRPRANRGAADPDVPARDADERREQLVQAH